MTKQEHKLKSMLNYYEVDLKGNKDEKMSKEDLKFFLNKFNNILDYYILQDIIQNIKKGRDDKKDENFDIFNYDDGEDEDEDPMLPKKENKKDKDNIKNNKKEDNDDEDEFDLNDPISTDINKFLKWLTLVLYSGDHSVIITEDKNGIYIKLVKINKGKK